jgi:energy-coupling factor transporter ATP-binding protein EcfA2
MKIISLQAENFKKLHAVEITPDGNFVQITGRNGQGKTSTLDAIWVALAGTSAAPKQPIRKGAESARIRLDLGEIVVTRHFKAGEDGSYTTQLTVESAEGARYPSPQKMLDSLLGALSFDPLAFSRMDAKSQFNELRKFVPDVDFDAIDRANKGDYEKRTDINRRLKETKASAENIKLTISQPVTKIDESALVQEMMDAGQHNADIEKRKAGREALAAQIVNDKARTEELRAQITEWQDMILDAEERLKNSLAAIDAKETKLSTAPALPEVIETSAIAGKLNAARENNAKHTRWESDLKKYNDLDAAAKKLSNESAMLTRQIEDRTNDKAAKIAAAKLPIDGISFGEGQVLLNDLPFDQASDAEKLRTSVAIAMAANPKLPVVLIRDGSLLDEDGLRLVAEMADARGAQVWIERVGTGGVGIVLEDGRVAPPWNGITPETSAVLQEIHDANKGTSREGTLQIDDDEPTI